MYNRRSVPAKGFFFLKKSIMGLMIETLMRKSNHKELLQLKISSYIRHRTRKVEILNDDIDYKYKTIREESQKDRSFPFKRPPGWRYHNQQLC